MTKYQNLLLVSFVILIIGLTAVSATDSDNTVTTDNSGSDVAVDSSSSTTQTTDTSTHTDSSVDKTSDTSVSSSQKTDVTSQSTTQKVTEKTSENTQTTSDTTAKASSDTSSQSTQSSSQSTQQVQSNSNTTNENTNTVSENVVDNSKSISTDDDVSSESDVTVWNVTDENSLNSAYLNASSGDILNFVGNFSSFTRSFGKNLTYTSYSNAVFTNVELSFGSGSNGSTISNLYIDNSESGKIGINVHSTSDLTITNNTIIVNSTNSTGKGIAITKAENIHVEKNNIIINAVSNEITFITDGYNYEGCVDTYGIGVFNSTSNINISYNNISVSSSKSNGTSSSITGVAVQGSVINNEVSKSNFIGYNNITLGKDNYVYGVTVQYNVENADVWFNNIKTDNDNIPVYVCGVEIANKVYGSYASGNDITLTATDIAYGVYASGSALQDVSLQISTNNINLSANKARGIESYYTSSAYISGNIINVTGNYSSGIGVGGSSKNTIELNFLKINGTIKTPYNGWGDAIPYVTTGIYVTSGSEYYGNNTINQSGDYNVINKNNVTTDGNYSIILESNYNNITNNNLTSTGTGSTLHSTNSISNKGTGNKFSNNANALGEELVVQESDYSSFIVNQSNYQDYFLESTSDSQYEVTSGGLSDLVNDGDVLDIQGTITLTNNIAVDKAVNITSSTNDGMFKGDGHRIRLSVTEAGSNTNITNVTLYDMEFFTLGVHNMTIDNINVTSIVSIDLGADTGVVSIRKNSTNVVVKNSYFYVETNGGHSILVVGGANHVTIDNCTVIGQGMVGNLVYLTTFNTEEGAVNGYTNITNNTIIGPSAQAICRAVTLSGSNLYVANNFINYTGEGVTGQFYSDTEDESVNSTYVVNNTVVGTSISVSGAVLINNTAVNITVGDACDVINNTVQNQLRVVGENITIANNTVEELGILNLTVNNTVVDNNIMTGNSSNIIITGSNNTLTNNKLNTSGYDFNIYGSNNIIENNTIYQVSDSPEVIGIVPRITINSNSNYNTVRYNDLVNYDGFRETYLVGDDCVKVTGGTTGNIVQDNYGNTSAVVIPTPDEGTNYTYITYNVTSMTELINTLDDIKTNGTYSEDTKYVINLLDGDYTVTEAITWGNGTGDVKEVIINGTGQTINGNRFNSTFLTIDAGYSLTFNNVTISDLTLSRSINSIECSGNLTIYDSLLDNVGLIDAGNGSYIIINNTNFTQTAIQGFSSIINITNSRFYDTDLSSESLALITNNIGNLTFMKNNVTNITATYVINSPDGTFYMALWYNIVESNIFTDLNSSRNDIDMEYGDLDNDIEYAGNFINNTFKNGANLHITHDEDSWIFNNMMNNYINCTIPVNINHIRDSIITTGDYTTTVTVTADSSYGTTVDGQVTIFIDGNEYKTFNVTDGTADITIENSALNLLANQIEVQFTSEDGSYSNANTTFTLTLNKEMLIKIPEGTLYSGDTISIPVQVAINNNLATDGYVILKVNGKTVRDEDGNPIMVQVDENGNAIFNYTLPDTNSNEYNITAVYSGSEGIVRTNTTLTTSLKTATITVEPITAKAGQTVTLRAFITDQNGNAVSSGKLIFKLNGKTLKDAQGNTLYATIVNGVATLNYTIPDNYSAKDYILTAVYQGTGFERSEANSTLTLTKSTPTIIPDSTVFGNNNTITINQGTESVNIKATIYDPETNAPIDTTTVVTIKINDKTVTQQYVSNGQIDMTIYTSSFNNPTYNITVVVGENSQYARTSFNGTLEIVTPAGLATGTSYNGTLLVKED